MSDKLGVFICTGYGIADALDIDALKTVAESEFKADVCDTIAACDPESLASLCSRVQKDELTQVVIEHLLLHLVAPVTLLQLINIRHLLPVEPPIQPLFEQVHQGFCPDLVRRLRQAPPTLDTLQHRRINRARSP